MVLDPEYSEDSKEFLIICVIIKLSYLKDTEVEYN